MKPVDIIVTTSKGDNFKIMGVGKIHGRETHISFQSAQDLRVFFDSVLRDRDIELVNVEVEDIGF